MVVRPLLLAGCASWVVCASVPAYAWCRTHTNDPAASDCPETCQNEGEPLYWSKPNPTYAFNVKEFPGLSDAQLRAVFAASFQTWENVRCRNDETVGLDISAEPETTTLEVGPKESEPNKNVILHLSTADWNDQDLPAKAFAITAVWYDANEKSPTEGEILGADMMFNGTMDPFGDCPAEGCPATVNADLRNVATHEIGHFLGLSHSDVRDSTMWCDAAPRELTKRSLTQDDIDGLCNIYPPGTAFVSSETSGGTVCSLGGRARDSFAGAAALVLSALALLWRRRVDARAGARERNDVQPRDAQAERAVQRGRAKV